MHINTGGGTGRGAVSDSGRRRAERQKHPERRLPLVLLVLGALASGVAWVFLVQAAIDFGRLGRNGDGVAWFFAAAATVGATVCLLQIGRAHV